jgi:hypothetical protein
MKDAVQQAGQDKELKYCSDLRADIKAQVHAHV